MEALRWKEIPVWSDSEVTLRVKDDAVVHHRGHFYLLGGNNDGRMEVFVFDVTEKKWKRTYNIDYAPGSESLDSIWDNSMGYKISGTPPLHRNGHTATLVTTPSVVGDNGKEKAFIFVIGGWSGHRRATSEVHILDISDPEKSIIWLEPSEISGETPGPCNLHSADFISGQREIYVFRGGDGTEYHNDLHGLNVDTLIWRRVAVKGQIPERRANHASAYMPGTNQMFVFGGWNGFGRLNDIHVFDVKTSIWTQPVISGEEPLPRTGMTLTAVGNNLFIFGGVTAYTAQNGEFSPLTLGDLHILDCDTMSFVEIKVGGDHSSDRTLGAGKVIKRELFGDSPTERSGHCATAVGRFIYVIGGGCGKKRHNDVFVLDTDSLEFPGRKMVEPTKRIVSGMHEFCNNEELSDVTFLVEGREIYAHKLVLSLVSEYYRAMFTNSFREKADRPRIEVPNCTYDAFLYLMRYIYSGDFDFSLNAERFHVCVDILKLADQLLLDDLKYKCEETLKYDINSQTLEYLFGVANVTNSEYLIYHCEHYKRNLAKYGVDEELHHRTKQH